MTLATIIGTIELPAGTIHDASYETAAWYRKFEYDTQTVEVYLNAGSAFWKVDGRTTYKHFPTLFGGVATGGGTIGECDEAGTYTVRVDNHVAAAMVEAGEITLTDGFEIVESFYGSPIGCRGYSADYGSGEPVYTACDHELHFDLYGRPTRIERDARGFLPFGYTSGPKERKRHIRIEAI
jgi:hypothetical protein